MNIPKTLAKFYPLPFARRLTFAVALREGLARMQSCWYSASTIDETDRTLWHQCFDCRANTFQEALARTLTNAKKEPPVYDDWLWASMYAHHLSAWVKNFHADQFFIVPFRTYVDGTLRETVCSTLMRRLDYRADCSKLKMGAAQLNAHKHPPLAQDLTPQLIMKYDSVMRPENDRLVQLLAEFHNRGATLINFHDSLAETGQQEVMNSGNTATLRLEKEVRKWLTTGW